MERSWRRQLFRNCNTKRTDGKAGKKSRKEDCGKINENVPSEHPVSIQSNCNMFKYILIIYNVHNTLQNSHILSTHKLVLAAGCTEDYKIHRCNPFYYKWH